jgi:putative membrane protein insertion efficiency factor
MTTHAPLWMAGAPLRSASIGLIRLYRMTLSGLLGGQCRFYPTCSQYAEDAIRSQGFARGWALAIWRVLRCNPFGRGGIEPAPAVNDAIIHEAKELSR